MLVSEPIPVESFAEELRAKPEGKHYLTPHVGWRGKRFMTIHIEGKGFLNLGFLDPHFLVVFPNAKSDSSKISHATVNLVEEGPSEANPGAAGTIAVEENLRRLKVTLVQSHYKVGDGISRSFASKMSPWRVFAFKQLFEIAKNKRKNIQFSRDDLTQGAVRDLIKAAKEEGYGIRRSLLNRSALIIKVRKFSL